MATERQKMLAGEPYDPDDPELVAGRERAAALTSRYNRTAASDATDRQALLEALLGSCGEGCEIRPPFRCDYGEQIHIGEQVYANVGCVVLDVCRVDLGAHCQLGPGVHIYTATHPLDPGPRRGGRESGEPVTVAENVWIGGRAVLTPGVTVGENAVVAAGAVVTDDVPAGVLVGGNPGTVLRDLE